MNKSRKARIKELEDDLNKLLPSNDKCYRLKVLDLKRQIINLRYNERLGLAISGIVLPVLGAALVGVLAVTIPFYNSHELS